MPEDRGNQTAVESDISWIKDGLADVKRQVEALPVSIATTMTATVIDPLRQRIERNETKLDALTTRLQYLEQFRAKTTGIAAVVVILQPIIIYYLSRHG